MEEHSEVPGPGRKQDCTLRCLCWGSVASSFRRSGDFPAGRGPYQATATAWKPNQSAI